MSTTERPFAFTSLLTADERRVWQAFLGAHAKITQWLDEELRADAGLSLSSFEVLYELARAPENRLRMRELAHRLRFTRSGVTRLVDRLESAGYVERRDCAHDGRGVYALLTDLGFSVFESAAPAHVEEIRRVFLRRLGADGEVLGELLERLGAEHA